jgi:hypothetical protein
MVLYGLLFISVVNYYWGDEQQAAFEGVNKRISQETGLAFPDFV